MKNKRHIWLISIGILFCIIGINPTNYFGSAQTDITSSYMIPEPDYSIDTFNISNSGLNGMPLFQKAYWIHIIHGNLHYMLQADRFPDNSVRYQQNIHIQINDTDFMAQFTLDSIKMQFSDFTENIKLDNCSDFDYEASNFTRVGGNPQINFNLTYYNISIQTYGNGNSTLNFKICHYFMFGENQSKLKIETWTDLNNSKFYNQTSHQEIASFTPMNLSLGYSMGLVNNTGSDGPHIPISPNKLENDQLYYDIPYKNGENLSISKFDMNNTFYIFNNSEMEQCIARSSISKNGDNYFANHYFENLTYSNSTLIYSDPMIILGHDRVINSGTSNSNSPNTQSNNNSNNNNFFSIPGVPITELLIFSIITEIYLVNKKLKKSIAGG